MSDRPPQVTVGTLLYPHYRRLGGGARARGHKAGGYHRAGTCHRARGARAKRAEQSSKQTVFWGSGAATTLVLFVASL